MDKVANIFKNPRYQGSLKTLWERVKQQKIEVTYKQVREWYSQQGVNQVLKRGQAKRKNLTAITAPYGFGSLQADLLDLGTIKTRSVKFLLNVVDIRTRFAWSRPLKNKSATEVAKAFRSIFADLKERTQKNRVEAVVTHITTDSNDFKGAVAELFREKNINHYQFNSKEANNKHPTVTAVVERFNQTLWGLINRYLLTHNTNDFVPVLPKLLHNYNHRRHATTGHRPFKLLRIADRIPILLNQAKPKQIFKKDDRVRIRIKLAKFAKKSLGAKWSEQVYTVTGYKGNKVVVQKGETERLESVYDLLLVHRDAQDLGTKVTVAHEKARKVTKQTRDRRKAGLDVVAGEIVAPVAPRRSVRDRVMTDRGAGRFQYTR